MQEALVHTIRQTRNYERVEHIEFKKFTYRPDAHAPDNPTEEVISLKQEFALFKFDELPSSLFDAFVVSCLAAGVDQGFLLTRV